MTNEVDSGWLATEQAAMGERRLASAILTDALAVLSVPVVRPRQRRLYQETVGWITADDTEYPFSFRNVCDTLGIDAARLRMRIASEPGLLRADGAKRGNPVVELRRSIVRVS